MWLKKILKRGGTIAHIWNITNFTEASYWSASILQFTSMWSTSDFIRSDFPEGETQHRLDLLFNQQQGDWSPSNGETAGWGRQPYHPWPAPLSPPAPRPGGQSVAWGRRIESIHGTMWAKRGLSREDPPKKLTSSILISRAKQPVNHDCKCGPALLIEIFFIFYKWNDCFHPLIMGIWGCLPYVWGVPNYANESFHR